MFSLLLDMKINVHLLIVGNMIHHDSFVTYLKFFLHITFCYICYINLLLTSRYSIAINSLMLLKQSSDNK